MSLFMCAHANNLVHDVPKKINDRGKNGKDLALMKTKLKKNFRACNTKDNVGCSQGKVIFLKNFNKSTVSIMSISKKSL